MKKILFAAAILTAGFITSVSAAGPQSDQKTISGKAQVIKALVITPGDDLQFGLVTQQVSKTISNTGTVLQGTLGTSTTMGSEKVGWFGIEKGINTIVTLNLGLPTYLAFGDEHLAINYTDYGGTPTKLGRLYIGGTTPVNKEFTPVNGTNMTLSAGNGYTEFFQSGALAVYVGGTVVPTLGQVEGDYTGTITLTATYN